MPRRIGRLKNYKIMSSERAGLNNEQSILAFTLSSLALPCQSVPVHLVTSHTHVDDVTNFTYGDFNRVVDKT